MTDIINVVAKLRAFELGRAVKIASHQQMLIQPDALVIVPLAMAGEDTSLHAVAIGVIGSAPQIFIAPDPRIRDDQYQKVVLPMGAIIEKYYTRCRERGSFPQIWTASGASLGHIDLVADRLRFVREDDRVKYIGELLTYATERSPIAGQQALMSMTGALAMHYATGQQDGEDEHLGAFHVWLNPPLDGNLRKAIALAEREIMGVNTDPDFDRDELIPLLAKYHAARKSGASAAQIAMRAKAIEDALSPLVSRIYSATQQGFAYLIDQFPKSPALEELRDNEARLFAAFMKARDEKRALPYRDRPKAAAFKMAGREHAEEAASASAIYHDALARERARMAGLVLTGQVRDVTAAKEMQPSGKNKTVHRFIIETEQTNLHLRARDELAWLDDPRLKCIIDGVSKEGALTHVRVRVSRRGRGQALPSEGALMEFGPPPADWFAIVLTRNKMFDRLAITPWTHDRDAAAPNAEPLAKAAPGDVLAAIEALR